MGQARYLIDSNAVIDYLNGKLPPNGNNLINSVVDDVPQLSVITKIEVLGFNTQTERTHYILVDFINVCIVFYLADDIVNKTILLRKLYRIKLPDAIIAATALVHNLVLVSRNISDFKKIKGLRIVDPHNL